MTLEPGSATIEVGRGVWFNRGYSMNGGAGCYAVDSLTSSDTTVAAVSWFGSVLGRSPGTVTITYRAGAVSASSTVTVVPLQSTFVAVSGGSYDNICMLSSDGDAYCDPRAPVVVWGGFTFTALDVGHDRTCGLTPGRLVYCWGVGVPGGNRYPSPAAVLADVSAVDAGGMAHLCVLAGAGAAYCWGSNAAGQLGNPSVSDNVTVFEPVAVSGGLAFHALALGDRHSCALTADGSVYCWGDDSRGQLGTESVTASCGSPAKPCQLTPIRAASGYTFASLVAGGDHTCGLTADGAAYCWGANAHAQMGTGDTLSGATPRPVAGHLRFSSLSAGSASTCGVTMGGDAYCWGLGPGGTSPAREAPSLMAGGLRFSSLTVGRSAICGIASAIAYCWSGSPDESPVRVPGQAS